MYSQISGGRSGSRDGTIPKGRVRIFPALSSPSALQVDARDGVSGIVHRRARDCGTKFLVGCGRVCARLEHTEEWEVEGETRKIRSPDAPAFVAPRVAADRSNESHQPWMLRVPVYIQVVDGTNAKGPFSPCSYFACLFPQCILSSVDPEDPLQSSEITYYT